jgi:hypothetical protein
MCNDLKSERESAIAAVMRHLIGAYEMCKTQDHIDLLTFNLGVATGRFMRENQGALKTPDKIS